LVDEASVDLKEKTNTSTERHPWETARPAALKLILKKLEPRQKRNALDIGCGDGFISNEIFKYTEMERLVGVDVNFTDEELAIAKETYPSAEFHNTLDEVGEEPFDLILMLDVLEHIEDDSEYLDGIVRNRLKSGGHLLITVPAFQFLFSEHDRFLRHFRRYDRTKLRSLIAGAGLKGIGDGYLFASLLPVRMVSVGLEKLAPHLSPRPAGIGNWRRGPLTTSIVNLMLRADNRMIFSLGKRNLHIPGLTVWTICKKPHL
jgi:SAM-dependent methyltransferase